MSFKLEFHCWNCQKNWKEEFPKGTLVKEDFSVDGVGITSEQDGETKYLKCPYCGSVSTISKSRENKQK